MTECHPRALRIYFSAGEPSGDIHAANLIRQLRMRRPDLQALGYGGPQMAAAGCQLHADLTTLAVMWFARAIWNLGRFLELGRQAKHYFATERPDAVVLIDYPGFNWWIASYAKRQRIPVFYYTPPQIWAWGRWRVHKMRRFVDHVLCSLPFEEPWFRQHGCRATFVGHPFFDEVRRLDLDARFVADQRAMPGRLVTILPGSRTQEVTHNLPWFLKAAERVRLAVPDTRFAIAAFKPAHAEMARRIAEEAGWRVVDRVQEAGGRGIEASAVASEKVLEIHCGRTPELMHLAHCCMACSGSVSMELVYHAKPTVILYWVSRLAYWVQGFFRKVKYITLVNLLSTSERTVSDPAHSAAGESASVFTLEGLYPTDLTPFDPAQPDADKVLFPEYLTWEDRSPQIAQHLVQWLTDPGQYQARVAQLERLRAVVGHGGASGRAAAYILEVLDKRE